MAKVQVNVLVSDSYMDRMPDVKKDVERAGLAVEQDLSDLGVMIGVIDDARLDELRAVDGISAVEEQQSYQLPPPGDDIQ